MLSPESKSSKRRSWRERIFRPRSKSTTPPPDLVQSISPGSAISRPTSPSPQPSAGPFKSSDPFSSGQDFWTEALNRLDAKNRALIEGFIPSGSRTDDVTAILDTLVNAAREKQRLCQDRQWEFSLFQGRQWNVRHEANKVIDWLDRFKQAGDIAVNVDPVHAGLPWALMRILLQAAVSDKEQLMAIFLGLERVMYVLERCKLYHDLYLKEICSTLAQFNLESAISALYTCILKFLANALQLTSKATAGRVMHAFWKPQEIMEFKDECIAIESRVEIEATNLERYISHQNWEGITQTLQDVTQKLKNLETSFESSNESIKQIENIWQRLEVETIGKILLWTSDLPSLDHHRAASAGRTPNTGNWVLERPEYKQWLESEGSMMLWLHGIPGAGKTKLVSLVVDSFSNLSDDHGFAYFYCNRTEEPRRSATNVLRSLIKQLAVSKNGHHIHQRLVDIYNEKKNLGFSSAQIDFEEAESLLFEAMGTYKEVTLVVDALDECKVESRAQIIQVMSRTISAVPNLKVFLSSRRNEDIRRQFSMVPKLGIEATDNREDIATYVREKIHNDEARRSRLGIRTIDQNLKEEITRVLLEKSQGMFQWAFLQISQLLTLERASDIRQRLGRLPQTLKASYDEVMATIESQEGSHSVIATRAFQWLMASCIILPVNVLVAAVCQDPFQDDKQAIDIDIGFILASCHNLITVDGKGLCHFSHLSVEEYFDDHAPWTTRDADELVASVYLVWLNQLGQVTSSPVAASQASVQHTNSVVQRQPSDALLHFAIQHWHNQARKLGEELHQGRTFDLLKRFFGSPEAASPAYMSWHGRRLQDWHGFRMRQLDPKTMPILAICVFGFKGILVEWSKTPTAVSADIQNNHGDDLLSLAAAHQNKAVLRVLLSLGLDPNAEINGRYGSCLAAAAAEYAGDLDSIQLLIDHGADVNKQIYGRFGSALAAASAATTAPDTRAVQLLIDSGASVNALLNGEFGSSLAAAAHAQSRDVVQLLLDNGANVNLSLNRRFHNAITAAAASVAGPNLEIVRLLLDHGAEVTSWRKGDATSSNKASLDTYSSPLVAAAYRMNKNIIELLLQHGADVNVPEPHVFGSVFAAAAISPMMGSMDVLELLLKHGASATENLTTGRYGSALAAAAFKGDREAVEFILDQGADINASLPGWYGSCLAAAAAGATVTRMNDDTDFIQFLLDRGADVDAKLTGNYEYAIEAAGDVSKVANLLIKHSAFEWEYPSDDD